jgi:CHAT domain-containing protein/tetratricopeptide (TPR) repeat protein
MPRNFATVFAVLFVPFASRATPEDRPPPPQLTPSQQQKLKERDRYADEISKLLAEGRLTGAIAACQKKLAIERNVFSSVHQEVAGSLEQLAEMHEEQEDFAAAGQARQEVLAIQVKLHNPSHWRVGDARRALEHLDHLRQLPPEELARLKSARQLGAQVAKLYDAGNYREALPLAQQTVEISKRVLGEAHPNYAASLNDVALLHSSLGDYTRAEPLYRQAMEIFKNALGQGHPEFATSAHNLAVLYQSLGDYARAEPLHRQAVEIRKRALGEAHPTYANSLQDLARLYWSLGDYARAEPLYRQALELARKTLGEAHRDYATCLNNLGTVYQSIGDYPRAEPLYRQALEIYKKALGEGHPDYAVGLHNLAELYRSQRDYARAEPLYRQALEILRKARGEADTDYATCLNNLALLHRSRGDYARAEPLYRQALEIRQKTLGEGHPLYANSLDNLAKMYWSMGDYTRAEPLSRRSVDIHKMALGEAHPFYALSLNNLALLYLAEGEPARAEPLLKASLEIARRNLELAATAQSERQQLAMAQSLRSALDVYLSLTAGAPVSGAPVYRYVLRWKGAVFTRQQSILHGPGALELTPLLDEWQRTTRRLATLALAVPEPKNQEAWRKQLAKLTEKKEQLEGELSRRSTPFRTQREQQERSPAHIQAVLPQDVALIDFLAYEHFRPPAKDRKKETSERHLAAFVVRAGRPIEQVDLGPLEEINQDIAAWRAKVQMEIDATASAAQRDTTVPAAALRRRLWKPLEKYLTGVRTVLVSADGTLAQLPFAALPGQQPDRYLLEEVAIASVPVPQLLPELLSGDSRTPGANASHPPESLLLVGDVDFGAASSLLTAAGTRRSAARGSPGRGLPPFRPLPATLDETLVVQRYFQHRYPEGRVRLLEGSAATEEAVRQQAPKHRYLHLATHGYFAPQGLLSALGPPPQRAGEGPASEPVELFGRHGISGFHPGLLSGVVLAGANRPVQADEDDGILTALEVSELDLAGVELAVLSACETGLGQVAGGEGLLGLQRAFQEAGARSVLASLWQVDDESTRQLMERFYENLWQKRLGKLEALREAQLALLRQGSKRGEGTKRPVDPKEGAQGKSLEAQGLQRGEGTKRPIDPKEKARAKPLEARTSPFFWAGFVLSGDWR